MSKQSDLERAFDTSWIRCTGGLDVCDPVQEYRFHPTRKWRFDRAWVDERVAVEIDGGTFSGGRHTRGMGYHRQIEKSNAAILEGWVVLRYDTKHINDDPASMVDEIVQVLAMRGGVAHGQ